MPRYITNLRSDIINASSIKAGLEEVTDFSSISTPLIGMKVVKNNIIYEYIGEPIGWVDDNSQYISYDTSNNKLKFDLPNNQPTDVSVLQIDISGFISYTPISQFANTNDISANTVLINANTNAISENTDLINESDDRIKHDEVYITNPTDSLLKISPQVYYKAENIGDVYDPLTSTFPKHAGVMAQDIWYNTPELRHLVNVGDDADMTKLEDPVNTQTYKDHVANNDIKDDPDYEELGWGTKISTVNYTQFIPYLIQGYKEQQSLITSLQTRIELLEG